MCKHHRLWCCSGSGALHLKAITLTLTITLFALLIFSAGIHRWPVDSQHRRFRVLMVLLSIVYIYVFEQTVEWRIKWDDFELIRRCPANITNKTLILNDAIYTPSPRIISKLSTNRLICMWLTEATKIAEYLMMYYLQINRSKSVKLSIFEFWNIIYNHQITTEHINTVR